MYVADRTIVAVHMMKKDEEIISRNSSAEHTMHKTDCTKVRSVYRQAQWFFACINIL